MKTQSFRRSNESAAADSVNAPWLGQETGHNRELEVRSATTLAANLNLRSLSFAEWQAKVQSPEYRAIEKKLPRPVVAGLPTEPLVPTEGLPKRSNSIEDTIESPRK